MRYNLRYTGFFILLGFLAFHPVFAQQLKTVTVNLGSWSFEDALPFDVPFNIKHELGADSNVERVAVSYRIAPGRRKNSDYFPSLKDMTV